MIAQLRSLGERSDIRETQSPHVAALMQATTVALKPDEMRLNRHCERSEAIHCATSTEWLASSLSLLAMTAKTESEPYFVTL